MFTIPAAQTAFEKIVSLKWLQQTENIRTGESQIAIFHALNKDGQAEVIAAFKYLNERGHSVTDSAIDLEFADSAQAMTGAR